MKTKKNCIISLIVAYLFFIMPITAASNSRIGGESGNLEEGSYALDLDQPLGISEATGPSIEPEIEARIAIVSENNRSQDQEKQYTEKYDHNATEPTTGFQIALEIAAVFIYRCLFKRKQN
jgi:hypothetical protein